MRYVSMTLALVATFFFSPAFADDAPNPIASLAWQLGPGQGAIGDKAKINVPDGYAFLGAADTKKFMELNHNFANDNEYLLAPKTLSWFAVFQFNPVGYVKDDETLDADQLLETVKTATARGNEERRRRGWGTMSIVGWRFQPQYDKETKRLEWAFLAKDDSDSSDIINYNTRLLGRTGVMQVVLVADPATLDTAVATLKTALTQFEYVPGEKYTEFKQGDRVAEFGLAALVAGGAAAVAAKKGFFTVIAGFLAAAWKFLVAAAVGALAWLKSLLAKKKQ